MAVASMAVDAATEILMPSSEDEAIAAFGDGTDVVVVGGGTIVVPDMTYRRLRPSKALMLGRAGSRGITKDGSRVTIGATTPVQELTGLAAPLGPCAANVADLEIRSQGTVGGNLCAGEGPEAPRGDLQGAFLAVGATVRSAAGRRRHRGAARGLPRQARASGSCSSVCFDEPAAGGVRRRSTDPHTHDYTVLAVSGARAADGTTPPRGDRSAARGGLGSARPRLRPKTRLPRARPRSRTSRRTTTRSPRPGIATKMLPVLVRRVLTELEESA